ncbi:MAG: conserved membrane protein of unknown function [Candidatus Thorarchaeota archaeon]|nr:MAG: conserved membrane protein of unknown function [Candidatus Thorarchaeota archaeon]
MTSNWRAIAKAEFLVQTSKFQSMRKPLVIVLYLFSIFWAILIVPLIEASIIDLMAGEVEALLTIAFPGAMRSVMLLLWMMLLVYPIIYALQEIKIGQWEIMLSHNVQTREILVGTFLGKVPGYFLLTFLLAPILISPFLIVYEVTLIGILLVYLTIFIIAITTIWISIVLSTAIQAKLGESEKGEDIAKAFGMLFVLLFLLPLYGLMYFAPQLATTMGLDVFMILPSTWGADVVTAITLFFSGLNPTNPLITTVTALIEGKSVISGTLFVIYILVSVIGGLMSAEYLFQFEAGPRTESITTTGKENIVLRAIRRIRPTPSGVLLITALKDFGRKAENISRLMYGMFLAVLLPFILNVGFLSEIPDKSIIVIILTMMINLMLAMIAAVTVGGTGFIESKDHLWILKAAPYGSRKFIRARTTEAILLMIPVSLVPTIVMSVLMEFSLVTAILVCINVFVTTCGGTMAGIGITAINPTYENRQSAAFKVNSFITIAINMIGAIGAFILATYLEVSFSNQIISLLGSMWVLPILGLAILSIGATRLSIPE